jgi:hypothetical protein
MGLFSKTTPEGDVTTIPPEIADEKGSGQNNPVEKSDFNDDLEKDAQGGVQKIEAAAQVWTKWHMVAAYVMYEDDFHMMGLSQLANGDIIATASGLFTLLHRSRRSSPALSTPSSPVLSSNTR